ncbi:MAG: YdcF family protein [Sulfurimonas sp.]|uniref:ElyC/SanA/YdcF family protein n=1 Tax=Sulfurimonas sp. TaxID=2022749 RepID=UPI0025E5B8EB|nr:ElyC/SanA/YdcF family protein [Sulfurimonas sp.]MCK9491916.1 YdcF family protein [Sulfurimonas sp.]
MDLLFSLKKLISFCIKPYGLVLIILMLGLYFLFTKKEKLSRSLISLGVFLLFLFAYPPFSNMLVSALEDRYVKYDYSHGEIKYIHVLGSGHVSDETQPISSLLGDSGVKRVLEGILLHKNIENSKLIFTGYANKEEFSNASVNAKLAISLGVKEKNIILGEEAKDTNEEAHFAKSITQSEAFILVTSATHMQRAIYLFNKVGLHPKPAPTDFHRDKNTSFFELPSIYAFKNSQMAMHEYIGILWSKLR